MKKITIYTTRFCGYCNAAKSGLSKKDWNIRKYVCTKETKWKNSERRIRDSGPHPKSSVTGKISVDSPTWSNVTPSIFNESKKI